MARRSAKKEERNRSRFTGGKNLKELPVVQQTGVKKVAKPYSPNLRACAVRVAMEHRTEHQREAACADGDRGQIGLFAGQPSRSDATGPAR